MVFYNTITTYPKKRPLTKRIDERKQSNGAITYSKGSVLLYGPIANMSVFTLMNISALINAGAFIKLETVLLELNTGNNNGEHINF